MKGVDDPIGEEVGLSSHHKYNSFGLQSGDLMFTLTIGFTSKYLLIQMRRLGYPIFEFFVAGILLAGVVGAVVWAILIRG